MLEVFSGLCKELGKRNAGSGHARSMLHGEHSRCIDKHGALVLVQFVSVDASCRRGFPSMIRVTTIVSSPGHGGCKHSLSIQPGLIQQRSLGPKASASNVFVSRQASAAGGLLCRGTNRLRWVAEASVSSLAGDRVLDISNHLLRVEVFP